MGNLFYKIFKWELVLVIFILILFSFLSPAISKSYWLPEVKCKINILEDGSLLWNYSLKFSFNGQFSYAYMDIPTKGVAIENISVSEPFTVESKGSTLRVRWNFPASNEEKTFNISYKMRNALKVYNDIAELYWKVWPEGWAVKVGKLKAVLILSKKLPSKEGLYIWGHPRLPGKVSILDTLDGFSLETESLPSHQWVEIRALFPIHVLNSYDGVNRINESGLEKILKEEETFTRMTERQDIYLKMGIVGGIGVILCIIVLLIYLYFQYGKEPRINYQGIYEREVPYKYSPAIVGALMDLRSMSPGTKDFTATLLDLIHKGYINMTSLGEEYILSLTEKDRSNLEPFEIYILDYLERVRDREGNISFLGLKDYIKKNPESFQKFYQQWVESVKVKVKKMNLFDTKGYKLARTISGIFLGIGIVLLIISLTTLSDFYSPTKISLLSISGGMTFGGFWGIIISVIFKPGFARRTEEGALHYTRWNNLKKFLMDFSQIKSMPPESLILWEEFLVYGTSLGIADKVLSSMKILIPNTDQYSHYPLITMYSRGTEALAFSSVINDFSSVIHSAATYSPPSSGSGGGFSGGGGGGGGSGGGGGAG